MDTVQDVKEGLQEVKNKAADNIQIVKDKTKENIREIKDKTFNTIQSKELLKENNKNKFKKNYKPTIKLTLMNIYKKKK